jgi:hypothetical protein
MKLHIAVVDDALWLTVTLDVGIVVAHALPSWGSMEKTARMPPRIVIIVRPWLPSKTEGNIESCKFP